MTTSWILTASVLFLSLASTVNAQPPGPSVSVEGIAGYAAFLDEDPVDHTIGGGVVRIDLSPRLSVGPEIVYMMGPGRDRDLFVTGNVWFDLVRPAAAGVRRATPYLVAGAGLMRHRDRFVEDFTTHEGALTGGVGVRIALDERWYAAPEARVGWEPHSRLSVSVGYRFRR